MTIMKSPILRLLPILALTLLAGCFPYRRTGFYRASAGTPSEVEVPAPGSYVFDMCREWSGPFPHMAKGWCFELAVRPELVREGAVIAVPGKGARPLLRVIPSTRSREAAGTVRIRRIVSNRILADVELADRRTGWSLRRAVWFRFREPPPLSPTPPIPSREGR